MDTSKTGLKQAKDMEKAISGFKTDAIVCAKRIVEFIKTRDALPVYPTAEPGYLRKVLPASAPEKPEKFQQILDDFFNHIATGTCHWTHPGNLAYFPVGNAFPNVYGDMLSTAFGGVGFSWTSQPALSELENVMMDWLAYTLNLPDKFIYRRSNMVGGGCTHNTATDATYTTMVSARDNYIKEHLKADDPTDHAGNHIKNIQYYVSSEGHSSVEKSAQIAMVSIRKVQSNAEHRMTGVELENAITEDIANNLVPVYCCATLGTPGTCSYDDLVTIAPVCQKYNMWLHVDAAYAGNALMLKEMVDLRAGLEHADSIVVNPYKLMLAATDLSCLFFSDTKKYIRTFVIDATYLIKNFKNEIDYRDYGIALSRRMRTLKLFFLFRVYGVTAIQNHIQNVIAKTKKLADALQNDGQFEIINNVTLGIICFRQKVPEGVEADAAAAGYDGFTNIEVYNLYLMKQINDSKKYYIIPVKTNKGICLRISINYQFMSDAAIDEIFQFIKSSYVATLPAVTAKALKNATTMDGEKYKDINRRQSTDLSSGRTSKTIGSAEQLSKIKPITEEASADFVPVYDDDDDLVFDMSIINSNKQN